MAQMPTATKSKLNYTASSCYYCFAMNVLFCVRLVSKVLNLACNSEYAPIKSSADDGGVKELANASTSSMNFTWGIPRSFSPSVMESMLKFSTSEALESSSVNMIAVKAVSCKLLLMMLLFLLQSKVTVVSRAARWLSNFFLTLSVKLSLFGVTDQVLHNASFRCLRLRCCLKKCSWISSQCIQCVDCTWYGTIP